MRRKWPTGDARRSPEAREYHQWYHTAGWRTLRSAQLAAEPFCRMCAAAHRRTPATVADHIVPHRGDRRLFFDRNNLQSVCSVHHSEKGRTERGGQAKTLVGLDGWPL